MSADVTAAEVIDAHRSGYYGFCTAEHPEDQSTGPRWSPQHVADMLAAAGYPTTPEALAEHIGPTTP